MKLKVTFPIILSFLLTGMLFIACNRDNPENEPPDQEDQHEMDEIAVPSHFDWSTTKETHFKIKALDNQNSPVTGAKLTLFTGNPEQNGKPIVSGVTDQNGIYELTYTIPSYYDSLWLQCDYLGLPSPGMISVKNGGFDITLGGSAENKGFKSSSKPAWNNRASKSVFKFLGGYDHLGVPDYLETENDPIDALFLQDVNNTLPERVSLPNHRPNYFGDNVNTSLVLTETCDVWVTFVSEGAGYKNVLGFYTYPTDQPPVTPDDIDTITIIFPNASFAGSGGGLHAGNKVYIGQFNANTSIGFALMANGWKRGQVTNGKWIVYSNNNLNENNLQQVVLLNDNGRDLFLLGIEDIKRTASFSDEDFNDAVFYATANPIEAVDATGLPGVDYTGTDTDHDNIPDHFDNYPTDPTKAFDNYYFSKGEFGSLVFEDMWPSKGDYDFNDAVIDYNFNQITNGSDEVVEIEGTFILRAHGAFFKNGFGIEFPFAAASVSQVSGDLKVPGNIVTLDERNLEVGQEKAVVIVWENAYEVLPHPGGQSVGVNTNPTAPYSEPDTMNITVKLAAPVPISQAGMPPYNPFLFVNGQREVEVHLINHTPTNLADVSLFGTDADDSNPSEGRYYKTSNNLPWGMNIVESLKYPVEKVEIIKAYNHFKEWAESSGQSYPDWYKDKPGYRNENLLYTPPE